MSEWGHRCRILWCAICPFVARSLTWRQVAHTQKNCELVTGNAEFSTAAFRLLLVPREAWRCLSSRQLAIASIQAANWQSYSMQERVAGRGGLFAVARA
jgi:hypothetical protein